MRAGPTNFDRGELGETRYERLRPAEIVQARSAAPVVYIPLGTLEWHGFHGPAGLDGLKAHALSMRCAGKGGGLVFPPVYFGENREGELIELFPEFRERIAGGMGLPANSFRPGYMGRSVSQQVQGYFDLLFHILCEASSLGFKLIVLVAGHYPLKEYANTASRIFYQHCSRAFEIERIPVTWAFSDYDLVEDFFPGVADHAGFWETSLLMALEPGLVDLSLLSSDEEQHIGILNSSRPARESSEEFGERAVQKIVERAVEGVQDRLSHPERYYPR
jgi:creatinine amidohydrolase